MGFFLRFLGCGACLAVGVGTAWLMIALGFHTVIGGRWLLAAGAVVGLTAPWAFAFVGRQLGTSGDAADRYEQGR